MSLTEELLPYRDRVSAICSAIRHKDRALAATLVEEFDGEVEVLALVACEFAAWIHETWGHVTGLSDEVMETAWQALMLDLLDDQPEDHD